MWNEPVVEDGQIVGFAYTCWRCKCQWISCPAEVICPDCNECNYLVDNHKSDLCGGNHSEGRVAKSADYDIADCFQNGYKPYRRANDRTKVKKDC